MNIEAIIAPSPTGILKKIFDTFIFVALAKNLGVNHIATKATINVLNNNESKSLIFEIIIEAIISPVVFSDISFTLL